MTPSLYILTGLIIGIALCLVVVRLSYKHKARALARSCDERSGTRIGHVPPRPLPPRSYGLPPVTRYPPMPQVKPARQVEPKHDDDNGFLTGVLVGAALASPSQSHASEPRSESFRGGGGESGGGGSSGSWDSGSSDSCSSSSSDSSSSSTDSGSSSCGSDP